MNVIVWFLMVVAGCFLAMSLWSWIKSELDERAWRQIAKREGWDSSDRTPLYRMVVDERSDRE